MGIWCNLCHLFFCEWPLNNSLQKKQPQTMLFRQKHTSFRPAHRTKKKKVTIFLTFCIKPHLYRSQKNEQSDFFF